MEMRSFYYPQKSLIILVCFPVEDDFSTVSYQGSGLGDSFIFSQILSFLAYIFMESL